MKRLLILICCLPACLAAQIRVLPGTSLTVEPGTTVRFQGPGADTFRIDSSALVINHGRIVLQPSTYLEEFLHAPITGNGYEYVNRTLTLGTGTTGINGLGLLLKGGSGTGQVQVYRWHQPVLNQAAETSVKRVFKIDADPGMQYRAGIRYDSTELNGYAANALLLFSSTDSSTWINQGGTDSSYQLAFTGILQDTQYLSAYAASYSLTPASDSILCAGDSIHVHVSTSGIFNSNTFFVLEYASDPDFTSPVPVDTLGAAGGDMGFAPPVTDTVYIRTRIQNPDLGSAGIQTLVIYPYPTVFITGLDAQYCLNGLPDTVALTPAGGILSGTGYNGTGFDPLAAGAGNHVWTYSFTNAGGCVSVTSDSTFVSIPPAPVLSAPDHQFCQNDTAVSLAATPAGGLFTGAGMSGSSFDPAAAGPGTYVVWYTLTDSLGCSGSDSVSMQVFALPATPVVNGSADSLWSSTTADHYQWYYNGSPIAGSDAPYYMANANGLYSVEVINAEGCSSFSADYNYVATGMNENTGFSINVYPNPVMAGSSVTVATGGGDSEYRLFSADGKQVKAGRTNGHQLDTRDLLHGVYLLQVITPAGSLVQHKLMVIAQ